MKKMKTIYSRMVLKNFTDDKAHRSREASADSLQRIEQNDED
jgi:hypothetical protein